MPDEEVVQGPRARVSRLVWWAAQAAVLFAWWLLLTGTTTAREMVAGVVAAVIGAFSMQVVEKQQLAKFLGRPQWLAQIWRLPEDVVTGSWQILKVLAAQFFRHRPAPSLLCTTSYDACGDDEASATKRALAVAYTTMTPSTVVIDVDQDRRVMIYHVLKKSDVPEMARRLGAGG